MVLPCQLDLEWLGILDRPGGKVVFTGGELNPDVDRCDLAFTVAEFEMLRTGDRSDSTSAVAT
jgi:hypothetical protein